MVGGVALRDRRQSAVRDVELASHGEAINEFKGSVVSIRLAVGLVEFAQNL